MADLTLGGCHCNGCPESEAGKVPDEYDHDRISISDLVELGIASVDVGDDESELTPGKAISYSSGEGQAPLRNSENTPVPPDAEAAGQSIHDMVAPRVEARVLEYPIAGAEPTTMATPADFEATTVVTRTVSDATSEMGEPYPCEGLDYDEEYTPSAQFDSLDKLWLLEIPEAEEEEGVGEAVRLGVSSDERATQLALSFLRDEELYSNSHLDLLTDIIRQRGWSSVQYQVRGLVRAGYEITQIHRMFQLTDAWLHCVESDTLAPERWHGGRRLTWLEAAQLLDFLGYDAEAEQIADFLSFEQEVWHGLRRNAGQLATFKNYLFGYRLSTRTQVEDGVWQVNLDPDDTRSFDGSRNPLFLVSWWDEPVESGAASVRQMFGAVSDPTRLAEWLAPEEDLL